MITSNLVTEHECLVCKNRSSEAIFTNLHFMQCCLSFIQACNTKLQNYIQKQPSSGVPRKSCFKDMQQIYRSCFATLLKSHFRMVVLLQISCIFSERLFLRTPLGGCFCTYKQNYIQTQITQNTLFNNEYKADS